MTYFQRKDVKGRSWSYSIMHKGKVYRGTIGDVTKTRAKEIHERIRVEIREGKHDRKDVNEDPYLRDFVPEYFSYYESNRKPNSVDRHKYSWVAILPVFGHLRLSEITPRKIEQYRQNRLKIGRSSATVNRELAFIRNVLTKAIDWGQAVDNPAKRVKQFREDNSRTRYLSDDEERRLLAECRSQLYPVVLTAIHTGLRRGELLSLKWSNVDLERRMVTVEAGYSKNHEARSVPMSLRLTRTLQQIKVDDPNAPVFLNSLGKPYREVKRAFNSAVKRAGISNFVFHDLRHTFASRLVMAGVDLATVKELMGHKTIAITMRYAHLSQEHRRSAIAVFDQ